MRVADRILAVLSEEVYTFRPACDFGSQNGFVISYRLIICYENIRAGAESLKLSGTRLAFERPKQQENKKLQ